RRGAKSIAGIAARAMKKPYLRIMERRPLPVTPKPWRRRMSSLKFLALKRSAEPTANASPARTLSRRFRRFWLGAFALDRNFFFRRHFVLRFSDAEQPMVEPANNILQSLDSMPRRARGGELVGFVRRTHHH